MTGPHDKPAAEVEVTPDLVRALLAEQHPDLADRAIAFLGEGWDNALFLVGDDLIARLPRREVAVPLVAHEQRWLPELASRLPLPISAPVRIGRPGAGYPWPWSVVPHLPGHRALSTPPDDLGEAAATLGRFVGALARPAPSDAPANPHRGVPLADRDERTRAWTDQLAGLIDAPSVAACWADHVALPTWAGPPVWLHGDLHPNNVLVDGGRISGVIDFGDLTAGDPATDLAIGWTLLTPATRPILREALGTDDLTWARARGWALSLGLAYLAHSADDPDFGRCGLATIDAVLADA